MFCQNRQGRTAVSELTVPFPVIACCHKRRHECFLSGFVQRLQVPSSKERAAWLVRDAETSRSRGRTRNYRGRSRSRPSQHQRRQDSLELPRSWKSTPTDYDSNREYGLNLPRQVVSNKFTRDLQIDGMDIFDVRLAQVMTSGLNNWGLRWLTADTQCGSLSSPDRKPSQQEH